MTRLSLGYASRFSFRGNIQANHHSLPRLRSLVKMFRLSPHYRSMYNEVKHPLSLYSILSVSLELIFSFLPGLDYSSPVRIFLPSRKILVNGVILLYFHLCSWSFIVSLTNSCFLSQNLCIRSVLFHRSLEFL